MRRGDGRRPARPRGGCRGRRAGPRRARARSPRPGRGRATTRAPSRRTTCDAARAWSTSACEPGGHVGPITVSVGSARADRCRGQCIGLVEPVGELGGHGAGALVGGDRRRPPSPSAGRHPGPSPSRRRRVPGPGPRERAAARRPPDGTGVGEPGSRPGRRAHRQAVATNGFENWLGDQRRRRPPRRSDQSSGGSTASGDAEGRHAGAAQQHEVDRHHQPDGDARPGRAPAPAMPWPRTSSDQRDDEAHEPRDLGHEHRAGAAQRHEEVGGQLDQDAGRAEHAEPDEGGGGAGPLVAVDGGDQRAAASAPRMAQIGRVSVATRPRALAYCSGIGRAVTLQVREPRQRHAADDGAEHVHRPAGDVERQHVEPERRGAEHPADDDVVDVEHRERQDVGAGEGEAEAQQAAGLDAGPSPAGSGRAGRSAGSPRSAAGRPPRTRPGPSGPSRPGPAGSRRSR